MRFLRLHTSLDFSKRVRTRVSRSKRLRGLHHPVRCYRASDVCGRRAFRMDVRIPQRVSSPRARAKGSTGCELEPVLPRRISELARRDRGRNCRRPARVAISFGSCSFEEPVADLKALKPL